MGLRYERSFAKALPEAQHGVWMEFEDAYGRGFAQADFLLVGKERGLVLETKYSACEEGFSQPGKLYVPLAEKIWGRPFHGVMVTKVLCPGLNACVYETLWEIIRDSSEGQLGKRVVLHWLSGSPGLRPPLAIPARSGSNVLAGLRHFG